KWTATKSTFNSNSWISIPSAFLTAASAGSGRRNSRSAAESLLFVDGLRAHGVAEGILFSGHTGQRLSVRRDLHTRGCGNSALGFDDYLVAAVIDDGVCIREDVIRALNPIVFAVKFPDPLQVRHTTPNSDHVVADLHAVVPRLDCRDDALVTV